MVIGLVIVLEVVNSNGKMGHNNKIATVIVMVVVNMYVFVIEAEIATMIAIIIVTKLIS